MKQWIGIAGVLVLASLAVPASQRAALASEGTGSTASQSEAQQSEENPDANFMRRAARGSMAEVELGRLATQNASAPDVKQFGQRMIDDHSKANEELKTLATKKNVTLPSELDEKHRAMHDKLAKLNGPAFDRAYMQRMVSAHREAVGLFQREAGSGRDVDGRAWARKTLPVLQQHLQAARDIRTAVRKGPK